ncbi:MAG: PilZ domain-containing protein [Planctomycetota bacterium]
MKANVTQKLTHKGLAELVQQLKQDTPSDYAGIEQRKYPRKPVVGHVEFWPANGNWQQPLIGECCDISEGGLGMSTDHYLEPQVLVGIAVYLDMACFHGLAIIRYCQKVRDSFMVGMEFVFED